MSEPSNQGHRAQDREQDRAQEVKLSCRNLWKIYGPDPAGFFATASGVVDDAAARIERIRQSGHIGAACNVSFDVRTGEIFVIMGLSGSGKSTVVRCLSRLVEPTAGEVLFDGADLLKASKAELIEIRRHKMGMVFQHFGLMPHLTVLENVAFPLKVQGIALEQRLKRAQEMVELVGLEGRETSFPHQLSGGQQQRVGIARSLAVEPEIWFLDEPFSALDPLIRRQMQDELLRLQRMLKKTIVFITHDFLEALRIADHIAIMKDGEVVQIGTPTEVVMQPADDYVREFTQDAPRIKLITAGDVMVPPGDDPVPTVTVRADTTIERLLSRLSASMGPLAVTAASGEVVGLVSPREVLLALASGQKEDDE